MIRMTLFLIVFLFAAGLVGLMGMLASGSMLVWAAVVVSTALLIIYLFAIRGRMQSLNRRRQKVEEQPPKVG